MVFFLAALEGTEKTYFIKAIQNCQTVRYNSVVALANSALAAKLIKCGITAHSAFKIPVPFGAQDTCHRYINSN